MQPSVLMRVSTIIIYRLLRGASAHKKKKPLQEHSHSGNHLRLDLMPSAHIWFSVVVPVIFDFSFLLKSTDNNADIDSYFVSKVLQGLC